MILSPNNTPILDIYEFTDKWPDYDYAVYFDSNGKDIVKVNSKKEKEKEEESTSRDKPYSIIDMNDEIENWYK